MSNLHPISGDLEADAILEYCKGRFTDVVLMGWNIDGDLMVFTSGMGYPDVLHLGTAGYEVIKSGIFEEGE